MRLSSIETVNLTAQDIDAGQALDLGTIAHKYSHKQSPFALNGNQLMLGAAGYYQVTFDVTYESAQAGEIRIWAYANGTLIPRSAITADITAGDGIKSSSSTIIVRVLPFAPVSLSFGPTGIGAEFTKIDVKAVKIA